MPTKLDKLPHSSRVSKYAHLDTNEGRYCPGCEQVLSLDHFKSMERSNRASIYIFRTCRDCTHKQARANRYGISVEELVGLGDECAICGTTKMLGVDHEHSTGNIRGLLCRKCNSAIGMLNDDAKLLSKALKYLEGDSNS